MYAYRRRKDIAPLILNLGTRWWSVFKVTPRPLYPQEGNPVPVEYVVRLAPEPVQTLRGREKSLVPTRFPTQTVTHLA